MKKLKDFLIGLLGGKIITVVVIDKTRRGVIGRSSTTFHQVKVPTILRIDGCYITIKPSGEVICGNE